MKKFLRTLVVLVLLVCTFLLIQKNTTRFAKAPVTVATTGTQTSVTESDIFVNPNMCAPKHTRQEYLTAQNTDCQQNNTCDQWQKDSSGIILADRRCETSGFTIKVIDLNLISWYQDIITQSLQELQTLWTLPRTLYHNVLETEIGFDAGFQTTTFELTGKNISGADLSRMFISMEWESSTPVFNFIVKKGNFIIAIQNILEKNTELAPILSAYQAQSLPTAQDVIAYYQSTILTNPLFQNVVNSTMTTALARFK